MVNDDEKKHNVTFDNTYVSCRPYSVDLSLDIHPPSQCITIDGGKEVIREERHLDITS
jgi:hypothetical protein